MEPPVVQPDVFPPAWNLRLPRRPCRRWAAEVVVATPGRLQDLVEEGALSLAEVRALRTYIKCLRT